MNAYTLTATPSSFRERMDAPLATLFALMFAINLIGTLAYAARIAGVRTRRIGLAFSLLNTLVLISRTANSFQAPLLARRVEQNVLAGATRGTLADFRRLLPAASLATVVGAVLTPTAQRLFTRAVAGHSPDAARSASLYAAYLAPDMRATASNPSAVVNGVATILLFVLTDPWPAVLTDDVVEGRARRSEVLVHAGRCLGATLDRGEERGGFAAIRAAPSGFGQGRCACLVMHMKEAAGG